MLSPTIGTVVCTAFKLPLKDWLPCDGRTLQISQNHALFSLLGTVYGGDGATNFALPDLQGRAPRHYSAKNPIATATGEELATLDETQLPAHTHSVQASSAVASAVDPSNNLLAASNPRGVNVYSYIGPLNSLDSQVISSSGSSPNKPHDNIQPYVAMQYQIAVRGIFPPNISSDDAFIGEIRIFASHQIPAGWLPCDGQTLSSASNQQLFTLLGNTYGSPSPNSFNLPDLRGRLILGAGTGRGLTPYNHGQSGGSETVALALDQMPAHNHTANSNSVQPNYSDPTDKLIATGAQVFNSQPNNVALAATTLAMTGNHVPHNNMMPFLTLTYCICTVGTFPS